MFGWHFVPSFERFDCQVQRKNRLNFLRALTNLVNAILKGKVPFELRPYFFGAKQIALKSQMEDFIHRCRQYFPSVVREMCRIPCLRMTSSKIRKSTSRCRHPWGAELASRVFRCSTESLSPKKTYFESAFNSINRYIMLEKTLKLKESAKFFLYGDSVL